MDDDWAKRTAEKMSPAEVAFWLRRLGGDVEHDTRSPIERMVDEACGVDGAPSDQGSLPTQHPTVLGSESEEASS